MLSFATFGVGFLIRLMLTFGLMSLGTLSIACVPGHAVIGLAAPLLVVAGRLLQGFTAGVELGSVSVYLSEIATPGHKGFYVSWQNASQQWAVVFAALLGVVLSSSLTRVPIAQASPLDARCLAVIGRQLARGGACDDADRHVHVLFPPDHRLTRPRSAAACFIWPTSTI